MTAGTHSIESRLGLIHQGDCINGMNALSAGSVDLVFADPPFNIGYSYDVYNDTRDADDYLTWSKDWMNAVHRVLKDDGTFWLAIGDEFAAELKVIAGDLGFRMRSWVIWYYTFGVNCTNKFTRSHTHLFYFVKDGEHFTFRGDDPSNRVPSARQLVYNDRRASSKGRLPDDTWIIPPGIEQTFTLRPQDLSEQFGPDEDTWYFPRVAGTFKERAGFHGCQMPEQLLGRIVRTCSEDNDIVMDPFSGSASTLVVAKKLGRRVLGFEVSDEYTTGGQARLDSVNPGDELTGAPEPTMSAKKTPERESSAVLTTETAAGQPATPARAATDEALPLETSALNRQTEHLPVTSTSERPVSADTTSDSPADRVKDTGKVDSESAASEKPKRAVPLSRRLTAILNETIATAFEKTHQGWAVDRVVADPELQHAFYKECQRLGLPLTQQDTCLRLLKLRKIGGALKGTKRYSVSGEDCESYLHGCEIAWATIHAGAPDVSLEEILATPKLARQFDSIAGRFAPGHSSLDYRWGALRLRKSVKKARTKGQSLNAPRRFWLGDRFARFRSQDIPPSPGIYLVYCNDDCIYVGSADNLQQRLAEVTAQPNDRWAGKRRQLSFRYFTTPENESDLLAWVSAVISQMPAVPQFNLNELHAEHA